MRRAIRSVLVVMTFILVGAGMPTGASANTYYPPKKEQQKVKTTVTVCKYFAPYSAKVRTPFVVKSNGYVVSRPKLKNDCRTIKLKTNKYGKAYVDVTEYVPHGCYLRSIKSYGKPYVKKFHSTAWVLLKKGQHVKIVFTDFCKRENKKHAE